MKIKLNQQERGKILIAYNNYIFKHFDLEKYLLELYEKYNDIIMNNNGNILEIVNDFYMDKEMYDNFLNISSLDELNSFIEKNYKELLITNIGLNDKYIVQLNGSNALLENSVCNGTLVFSIQCVIDFNKTDAKVLIELNKFNETIKKFETEIAKKIGIPVCILRNEKIIKKIK